MAPPPKDIPPELNAKWLALRKKHQEDSTKFQRELAHNRAEFEVRVDKARKALLDKHINEEREFWSKNGKVSAAAKSATPAPKSARSQTAASARASTVAPKKPSTPAARSSSSRPAVPRFEVDTPVTPSKATPPVKSVQAPSAPTKPSRRPLQKSKPVFIDLCGDSDDDKPPPAQKTSVAQKTTASSPVQRQPTVQEPIAEEPVSPQQAHCSRSSAIPEATLELFGSGASNRSSFATLAPRIKEERDETPFRFPTTPSQKETHGPPSSAPVTPFSQRASTVAPQFGQPASSTPPSNLDHESRRAAGLNTSSAGFEQRATSAMPASSQPSASNVFAPSMNHRQTADFSFGRTSSLGVFGLRSDSAAPSSPGFSFPSQTPSRFSSPLTHSSEKDIHWENPFLVHVPLGRPQVLGQPSREDQRHAPVNEVDQMIDGAVDNTPQNRRSDVLQGCARNTTGDNVVIVDTSSADKNTYLPVASQATSMSALSTGKSSSPSTHRHDTLQKSPSAAPVREPQVPAQQRWRQQLPSPPPSHASIVSEPTTPGPPQASTAASTFKKPFLPASAESNKTVRQSIGPEARHVRAGTVDSRVSSFTLPVESRNGRAASVNSRASGVSAHTGLAPNRKRKIAIDLSSDEEDVSDYAPSEPDSPLANKPTRLADGPAVKKSKTSNGSAVVPKGPLRVDQSVRKNTFGFKTGTLPKPRMPTSSTTTISASRRTPVPATSSKPSTPRPASSTGRQLSSARAPTPAQVRPKAVPATKKPPQTTSTAYFGKRAAARKAEDLIHHHYQDTAALATELAIEAADHLEDARLPEDMGRMSITPAPQDAESVDILATPDRRNGRCQASIADAEDEELDISEYIYVNGVIVHESDVERLELTGG